MDGMRKFISLANKRRICYALLLSLWLYHAYHELNWVYFFIYMCRKKKLFSFCLRALLVRNEFMNREMEWRCLWESLVCTVCAKWNGSNANWWALKIMSRNDRNHTRFEVVWLNLMMLIFKFLIILISYKKVKNSLN